MKKVPEFTSSTYIYPGTRSSDYNYSRLIADVCLHYNVSIESVRSKTRRRKYTWPRQVCMFLIKKYFYRMSLNEIGEIFNRDHATVIHSARTVKNICDIDELVRTEIFDLENIVRGHSLKTSEEE